MDKSVVSPILLFILIFFSSSVMGQEIIGFWVIEEVKVGEENMTPVAKWTKINENGMYETGNGWSQAARGRWYFDENSKSLRLQEIEGMRIQDENGPFKVSFKDDKMQWEREEDGNNVFVIFTRTDMLPKATADKLLGIWDLKEQKAGNNLIPQSDSDNQNYLFIKPDKTFTERKPTGELKQGYWHINAHKPHITFIIPGNTEELEYWEISIQGSKLKMVGLSDGNRNEENIFTRIYNLPN